MKRIIYFLGLGIVALMLTGCSILKHDIANDYGEYLIKHEGKSILPKTPLKSEYSMNKSTKKHHYEFRAITVGYENLWIVNFGEILDITLESEDVQKSFGKLIPKSFPEAELFSEFDLKPVA